MNETVPLADDAPPADLSGAALEAWNRVRQSLEKTGRWSPVCQRETLAMYARCHALYIEAANEVKANGSSMEHSNGIAGSTPAAKMMNEATKLLRQLLDDLDLPGKIVAIEDDPLDGY